MDTNWEFVKEIGRAVRDGLLSTWPQQRQRREQAAGQTFLDDIRELQKQSPPPSPHEMANPPPAERMRWCAYLAGESGGDDVDGGGSEAVLERLPVEGGDVGVNGRLVELATLHSSLQYPSASRVNLTVQPGDAVVLEGEVDAADPGEQGDRIHLVVGEI
ncbi:hypothetical protein WJX74_001634 [Apatococcus lobatus]|uniref:Uncharacterized protein n=1 Tax=Apatococcus lobatus TaxID=904363 RepID=A0AAW1R0Q2_9CHLO